MRALCTLPGLRAAGVGQQVLDVAGELQLLDPRRHRGVRRRVQLVAVDAVHLDPRGQPGRHRPFRLGRSGALVVGLDRAGLLPGLGLDRLGGSDQALAPTAPGPLLDDRGVVGLVHAELELGQHLALEDDRWGQEPGPEDPGPFRDLVQRDADHDEHAEQQQQDQQRHRDIAGQQIGEDRGGDVADDPAGLAQPLGLVGQRQAAGDVDQTEQAEHDRGPTDELAAAGPVAVGVAQRPPGHQDQQHGSHVGQGADQAGDPVPDAPAERAGQAPPELRGDHDRAAEQEQSDPVPAQCRVDIAGSRADPPGSTAHGVRETAPDCAQTVPDPTEHGALRSTGRWTTRA